MHRDPTMPMHGTKPERRPRKRSLRAPKDRSNGRASKRTLLELEALELRLMPTAVTIGASKDNTLFQSAAGSLSNGAGQYFFVGRTAQPSDSLRRGVLAFDIAGNVPAGATIISVSLRLHMSKTVAGPETVVLRRLLGNWGEGTSDANGQEGPGTTAATNDATWLHRFYSTSTWNSPGGDFVQTISAGASVVGNGFYTWGSTAPMVADVQGWLNTPASNFGWIVLGDESFASTAKRFDTKESLTAANRPTLTIDYTISAPVPPHLRFGQRPTNTVAGQVIAPAVTVQVVDQFGNIVASDTSNVTVAIGRNPGGSTLSGTLTVAAANGVATFGDLSLNNPGSGYTLTAAAGTFAGAASTAFNITSDDDGGGGGGGTAGFPLPEKVLVTAPGAGGGPDVHVYAADGRFLAGFFAFDPRFTGGVRVAAGDVDGDGNPDIVCAAGPGGGPNINVFSGKDGTLIDSFFAFDPLFTGGCYVAVGDVNGDAFADIIVGADAGGGPNVLVLSGKDRATLANYFPYDSGFTGGVRVAAGDVNGDGAADIVTGAGPGGGPNVAVFQMVDGQPHLLQSYFAFDPRLPVGIFVAVGDVDGDGNADVIAGSGPLSRRHTQVLSGPAVAVLSGADASLLSRLLSFGPPFMGAVRGAAMNANPTGNGTASVIAVRGEGAAPEVDIFNGLSGERIASFFAYDPNFTGGLYVAVAQ